MGIFFIKIHLVFQQFPPNTNTTFQLVCPQGNEVMGQVITTWPYSRYIYTHHMPHESICGHISEWYLDYIDCYYVPRRLVQGIISITMSNSTVTVLFGINSTSNVIEIVRGEAECYFNCFASAIDP